MTVSGSTDEQTISGIGKLTYNMNIATGAVGGSSVITISPNNNISGIGARLGLNDFLYPRLHLYSL